MILNLWRKKLPKYFPFKICGYYLYFTQHCVIEAMHVHASDSKLTEPGSAKFFVKNDGSTVVKNRGILKDHEIVKIHYLEMYEIWAENSEMGFFN